jgi:hypothetical protein
MAMEKIIVNAADITYAQPLSKAYILQTQITSLLLR